MLLPLLRSAVRRGLRGRGVDDVGAWAVGIPLVTLVVAAALALRAPR